MTTIPHYLRNKQINSKISHFVDSGFKSFDDLSYDNQDKLIALCMSHNDDVMELIFDEEVLKKFLKHLSSKDMDSEHEVVLTMSLLCQKVYEPLIDELFKETIDSNFTENMYDSGFSSRKDSQTGETLWRKSM